MSGSTTSTSRSASTRPCSRAEPDRREGRLCQVDARRSARQFRHLRGPARRARASSISASRPRARDELAEVYGRLKARRPAGARGGRDHLLLRQVREELDRRSRTAWSGRRSSPTARRRSMATARRSATLADTPAPPADGCLPQPMQAPHEPSDLQRPVPVHRQLGAVDPRRGAPQPGRRGPLPRLLGRQPSQGRGASDGARRAATSWAFRPTASARRAGTSSPAAARRSSISSSPSATMPPARSARSGRASR